MTGDTILGMGMLDATERTRPIMEYVNTLERTVRELRGREGRLSVGVFLAGAAAGALVLWLVFWIR
jgi:hypothetical protein